MSGVGNFEGTSESGTISKLRCFGMGRTSTTDDARGRRYVINLLFSFR